MFYKNYLKKKRVHNMLYYMTKRAIGILEIRQKKTCIYKKC